MLCNSPRCVTKEHIALSSKAELKSIGHVKKLNKSLYLFSRTLKMGQALQDIPLLFIPERTL